MSINVNPDKITVEQVTVTRRAVIEGRAQELTVLTGASFSVPAGGKLAVVGPSGSGKTSLLRVLNRLDDPAEGRVLLDSVDLRKLDPVSVRRQVGMVFQQPFLFDQSVMENLAYPLTLTDRTLSRDKAAALLSEVGLAPDFLDRRGQQLSGGQQQRIAIARALVLDPEVLLLDEPTSALDEESTRIVLDTLFRRNEENGLTLVVVTHLRETLFRMNCPTILVLEGQAQKFDNPESALQRVQKGEIHLE